MSDKTDKIEKPENPIFTQRVGEDLKAELNGLMTETGLSGKEFMQEAVRLFRISTAKSRTPEVSQDLEELNTLTHRMFDIYDNICKRINNITEGKEKEYQDAVDKKGEEIRKLREDATVNEIRLKGLEEKLQKSSEAQVNLNETIESLRGTVNSKDQLIEQLNEKVSALTDDIVKYRHFGEENENLVNQFREKEDAARLTQSQLQSQLDDANRDLKDTTSKLNQAQQDLKTKVNDLEDKHSLALEKTRLELSKENEAARKEEIDKLEEKYKKEVQEWQDRYKEVLLEIKRNSDISTVKNKRGPKTGSKQKGAEDSSEKDEDHTANTEG